MTLVELALEQAPSQGRGAHRSPTPEPRSRGRTLAAAVTAGAVTMTGTGAASAATTTIPTSPDLPASTITSNTQQPTQVVLGQQMRQQAANPSVLLERGSRGAMVRELQWVLNQWYPSLTPLAVDGIYGPKTEARVRYLQERAGIKVDGITGPQTFEVLSFPVAQWAQGGQIADGLADATRQAAGQAVDETTQQATETDEPDSEEFDEEDSESDDQQSTSSTGSQGELMGNPGTLTSDYGPRSGGFHPALDIANPLGTPIYAPADGKVIESGPASGFGLWVRIRNADGTMSIFGHINESLVSEGEQVSAGEQIATVGNRGNSTGPHLHFEVWQDDGEKIDPAKWLRDQGVDF